MSLQMPAKFLMVLLSLAALSLPAAKADFLSASVVWDKAVDGLQPGFLLTTPNISINRLVPLNSRVEYKVLVRNVSSQERIIDLHANFDPYLIPNDSIRDAFRCPALPERFHALGSYDLSIVAAAYEVKLAPGEAVVVPGERGLYLGNADLLSYPRTESVQPGKNWIVQPISIRRLNAVEQAQYERTSATPYSEKRMVTIVGQNRDSRAMLVPLGGAQSGGKDLFARIQIEVGVHKSH